MGLSKLLVYNDLLVMTGGVSAGKADYVPDILAGLGIRKHFHKIEQRPGKPMWFGTRADDQRVVFALPGNPVSTTMCFYRYVRPYLETAMGVPGEPPLYVQLAKPVEFTPPLTYFIPVRLDTSTEGTLLAYPLPGSGSADFANLTAADAFLELSANESEFPVGTVAVAWSNLKISGPQKVRDLWRQKDLGAFPDKFEGRVAPHGVLLVKISPQK